MVDRIFGGRGRSWRWLLAIVVLAILGCGTPEQRESIITFFFERHVVRDANEVAVLDSRGSPVPQKPLVQHPPYAKQQCIRCHSTPGTQRGSIGFNMVNEANPKAAARGKCFDCHKNPKEVGPTALVAPEKAWVHGPVANVQCVRCHNPHETRTPHLLKADRAEELCLPCHTEKKDDRSKAMGSFDCNICHNPHNSTSPDFRFLKQTKPGGLCVECHAKTITENKERPWIHAPVAAGLCVKCHTPHGGDERSIRRPIQNVCRTCHTNLTPKAEHLQGQECDACHNPHNAPSAAEHFLKTPLEMAVAPTWSASGTTPTHEPAPDFALEPAALELPPSSGWVEGRVRVSARFAGRLEAVAGELTSSSGERITPLRSIRVESGEPAWDGRSLSPYEPARVLLVRVYLKPHLAPGRYEGGVTLRFVARDGTTLARTLPVAVEVAR